MPRRHTYEVSVAWTGNQGSGTSSYREYGRDHQVAAEGRPPIEASSEPLFRGDPARWNPELELTAALSQCHMLWYLHLCAVSGVVVTSYADDAHGAMEETEDGGGQFTEVVLRPRRLTSLEVAADALHKLPWFVGQSRVPNSSTAFPAAMFFQGLRWGLSRRCRLSGLTAG